MTSAMPLVTIGVPVCNGEDGLARALDSALAQDYSNLEILISDNASVDATPEICRRYAGIDPRIRWWRNDENIGLGYNFALTAERARGEFFMWLAHDDWLSPEYIGTVIRYMVPRPDVLLCTTSVNLFGFEGPGIVTPLRLLDFYDGVNWRHARRPLFRYGHPRAGHLVYGMFRRAAMPDMRRLVRPRSDELISAFSESWVVSWIGARGRIVALPDILRTYRMHDMSASSRFVAMPRRQRWRLRACATLLRHAIEAPLPWRERLELAGVAAGNFLQIVRGLPSDPQRLIKQLRREVVMLRQVCDERVAVIQRLDAECKARQRVIDELRSKSAAN